jgi:hypothetical protein
LGFRRPFETKEKDMTKSEMKRWCLGGSAMAFSLLLSGCGGGGSGGVASTPPPTYTKLADLSGNQTFQSAGTHFIPTLGQPSGYSSQKYGSGVVIAYTASSDSYTLTAPDGTTATFSSSTNSPPPNFTPPPNSVVLFNGTGSLSVTAPVVNGVALSYTAVGVWGHNQNGVQSVYFAVSGVPTIASDLPKSGTATYQTSVGGIAVTLGSSFPQSLHANSTATFSANFGAGTVATTLHLVLGGLNQPPIDLGSYSGTGTITSGGPGFFGTLASMASNPISATGEFSGAFFGPQATEMGYAWYLTGGIGAHGITTGTK